MAAAEDISLLSRNIKSSMGEATGEFRKAAASSGAMSKIIKDLSSVLNAQRRDIAELSNTMSESAYEAEQTSSKMDHLSNLFREMISIQSNMQGVLRDISAGIRSVDNSIFSLNQNMSSGLTSGFSGLGTSLTGLGDNILNALKTLAIGAVGGAIGAAGYDAVTSPSGGGSGEGNVPQSAGAGGKVNASQAAALIRKVGGTEEEATVLGAISQPESAGNPMSHNPNRSTGDNSYGLWQINMIDKLGPERRAKFGLKSNEELYNPETNARVALQMLREAHGVPRDWTTWKHGKHLKYMEAARSGASGKTGGTGKAENSSPQTGQSTTPSGATPQSTPMASGATEAPSGTDTSRALNPESMAGHGHGPISGAMGGKEKVEGSSAIPSGDIIALGKYLEKSEGLRISEHPAFGGVKPVHKGRAHYEGRAIDINVGRGVTEASDPALGAKFDKLAEQLTKAGYKVYWRESGQYGAKGHNNHLHAEVPSGGAKPMPDTYQAGKTATDAEKVSQGGTPVAAPSPTTGMAATPVQASESTGVSAPPAPVSPGAAEPVAQAPVTPMPAGGGVDYSQMMSMIGGMGMGMGGIGGIVSSLAPLLMSAVQSSDIAQMQQPQTSNSAEMVQHLSRLAMNNQMVSETAVQQQAQQEISQEMSTQDQTGGTAGPVAPGIRSMSGGESYAYNYPSDNSWPDWAAMIGGNHWGEMKNFKKNMWA